MGVGGGVAGVGGMEGPVVEKGGREGGGGNRLLHGGGERGEPKQYWNEKEMAMF